MSRKGPKSDTVVVRQTVTAPCDLSRLARPLDPAAQKAKEPGKNPMPGLKMTFPN